MQGKELCVENMRLLAVLARQPVSRGLPSMRRTLLPLMSNTTETGSCGASLSSQHSSKEESN